MFIIKQNNNVIYGPAEYNASMFKYILIEDCELQDVVVPFSLNQGEKLIINDEISILPAELVYENINSKIEQYSGPFWSFEDDKAIGSYVKADKNIDAVKSELKAVLSNERYKMEVQDLFLNINGTDVIVDGSRENRLNISLSYTTMAAGTTMNWKFKNSIFVDCSKEDIGDIVAAFTAKVKGAFDFEALKISEIDACSTLEELDSIVIEETKNPKIGA